VHAIGDLANREALDAFEETREEWSPLGLRQRIEHAQLLAEEDVSRFAELGVAAPSSSATRRRTATSPSASGPA
jgi:predicted amidohydrolase YtcJ